jgi:hypothetical protein
MPASIKASESAASIPLHVTIHMSRESVYNNIRDVLSTDMLSMPISCDFLDAILDNCGNTVMRLAYEVGGVVDFTSDLDRIEADFIEDQCLLVSYLAAGLAQTLHRDKHHRNPGKIYLSDISRFILSKKEMISAAGKYNEVAKVKLCNLCPFQMSVHAQETKWDFFASRVELVDSGFRPSQAEMAGVYERRSVPVDTLHDREQVELTTQEVHGAIL